MEPQNENVLGEPGTELTTITHDRQQVVEVIVNSYDEHGNLIGQHKEVKS